MNKTASVLNFGIKELVKHFSISSRWLYEEDNRFDATTYAKGAFQALDLIEACKYPKKLFGSVCGVIWHPVQNQARSNFKRIYTKKEHGVPFVSSRDMFSLPLRPERHLSKLMPKLGDLMVKEGWLVISRSGTIGNVLYINKRLAACAISDHAIRIEPISNPAGYLYAFLSTSFGQAIIAKGAYGSTVDEIEPKHLASIPVPQPPPNIQEGISSKIKEAYKLRDEANDCLDEADKLLHELLGLTPFSEEDIEYFGSSNNPRAFSISSSELRGRFDANHHVPLVRSVIHKLEKGTYPLIRLEDANATVYQPPRFKRVYVDADNGIPFFQPSFVPLFRPYNYDYLSKTANADIMQACMLAQDSIIITRSGTAARVTLVTEELSKWVGSDDLIRVTPGNLFDSGFLTAFFLTPFARHQILGQVYGGVVDHVDEHHISSVLCPRVPKAKQLKVANLVRKAYKNKDEANKLEDEAIASVESLIRNGR
jgi:type I restriction enzyme S subunit